MQTSDKHIFKMNPDTREGAASRPLGTGRDSRFAAALAPNQARGEAAGKRGRKRPARKEAPGWVRATVSACVTLLLALVLVPAGYIGYVRYARAHKTYIELPAEMRAACAAAFAAGVPELAVPLAGRVQPERLGSDMRRLADEIGNRFADSAGDTRARGYILDEMAALGYRTEDGTLLVQPFTIDIEATRERKVKRKKPDDETSRQPGEDTGSQTDHADGEADGPQDVEGAQKPQEDEAEYEIVVETFHVYYDTASVVAVKRTAVANPPIVVLSAHLDTVYATRGAIDNGSGVAALLETARVLSESGRDFGVEIRFCFFSGEELGMHGANHYLETLSGEERARHVGMINIDMAACSQSEALKAFSVSTYGKNTPNGYETGSFSRPANNAVSAAAIEAFARNGLGLPRLYAPIHWEKNDLRPFHRAGIDAATISWREIDPARAITNFNIASPLVMHTTDDLLSTMDMQSLDQTARFVVETFEVFAQRLRAGAQRRVLGEEL